MFILSLLSVAWANQLYQKDVFSITLPDGWVEIPRDVIDAYEKRIASIAPKSSKEIAPKSARQLYDYGFQLDSAQQWFEYPYILVSIRNTGRIQKSLLDKFEESSFQKGVDKAKKELRPAVSNIQIGKLYYDKVANIIWSRIESDLVQIGPVSGLFGMILTDKGYIQVNGYSLKEDFFTYEPVFRTSAVSVIPSSDLIYKPKWYDSLPPALISFDWSRIIVGVIIGATLAMLSVFLIKKK